MIEIGRLVIKTAGRDANKKALVVDIIDNNFVLIDGETRRRKCSIKHLEPLDKVIKIKKNASHNEVSKALKEIKITARETKAKEKKERPRKQRKAKKKEEVEEKKGKEKSKKKEVAKEKTSKPKKEDKK